MFTLSASRVAPRAVVSAKTRAAKRSVVAMSSKVRPRKRSRVGWAIAIVDDGGDLAWAIARVIRANDDAWGGVSTRGGGGGVGGFYSARARRDGGSGGVATDARGGWMREGEIVGTLSDPGWGGRFETARTARAGW